MIKTQYEITGEWTSTSYSNTVVQTIADETDAVLDSIGKSYEGRELYRLTVGSGNRTIFITGGVHRSEPASREVVLIKARDLAYNFDGRYTDFLEENKIMFVPTVQPDREITRENAQGLNINRDAYSLETAEMPPLMKAITSVSPDIYVDFHERGGSAERVEFINSTILDANSDRSVRQSSVSLINYLRNELEGLGYATLPYPQGLIGPGKTVSAQSLLGTISFTPETHIDALPQYRVDGLSLVFDKLIDWYVENKEYVIGIKSEFLENLPKVTDDFALYNGDNEYYLNATRIPIKLPYGYQVSNPIDFQTWKDVYNLQIDETGYVPINQKAGRIIPQLLDPLSDNKVVSATRDEPPESEKRTDGRYTFVKYDEWREIFIQNYL